MAKSLITFSDKNPILPDIYITIVFFNDFAVVTLNVTSKSFVSLRMFVDVNSTKGGPSEPFVYFNQV